jgi:uncharacterized protein (DUF488 family)
MNGLQDESQSGKKITLFTIGFTGKSAEEFFGKLVDAGVVRLIDTRLNNVSQLAGFTKRADLQFFLNAIAGISYTHDIRLAPTKDMLDAYKRSEISWEDYETRFRSLLAARRPDGLLKREDVDRSCLLCSEPTAEHCHRRLVAEYLQQQWGDVTINHL